MVKGWHLSKASAALSISACCFADGVGTSKRGGDATVPSRLNFADLCVRIVDERKRFPDVCSTGSHLGSQGKSHPHCGGTSRDSDGRNHNRCRHQTFAPAHSFISMWPMPGMSSCFAPMARTGTVIDTLPAFSKTSVTGKLSPAFSAFFSPISMTW